MANTSEPIQSFSLTNDMTPTGRSPTSDIPIEDPSVSRQHARVGKREQSYFVIRLSGSKPVWANHEAAGERRLYAGDESKSAVTFVVFL